MINPLNPATWPLALEDLPPETYLVGGSVRDGLRGVVQQDLDLDFVTPGLAIPLAQWLARKYQASFVVLDAAREIARIIFPQATVDFAQQVGQDLITDLYRRDFTINAMAYNPSTNQIIDPLQGQADLNARQVRMIALENLRDDPLRVLRAYRQASQLQFEIIPDTRLGLKMIAPDLNGVATERIRTELSYLLVSPISHRYLGWAWEDGVLAQLLPQIQSETLNQLKILERWIATNPPLYQVLVSFLKQPLLSHPGPGEPRQRNLLNLTKLACLLSHEPQSGQIQKTLEYLTYSNREIKLVQTLLSALTQLPRALVPGGRAEKFFLFRKVGTAWPGLVLLGVAKGMSIHDLGTLTQAWLDPDDTLAHPPALITGAALIEEFGFRPGPEIGQVLADIEQAQAQGELSTPEQAQIWVRAYVSRRDGQV